MLGGVRQLQLGVLALGDVGEDALEARLAVLVDDPARLVANPDDVPVGVQEAVLVVEQTRLLRVALVAHDLRAVVGVDARQPELGVGHPLLRREAEHRLDLRADVEAAAGGARLPAVGGHGHAFEQRSEALFPDVCSAEVSSIGSSRRAAGAPAESLSATRRRALSAPFECGAGADVSCRRCARVQVIVSVCALLAACAAPPVLAGTLDGLTRRADRCALRPAPRPARRRALRADEHRRAAVAGRDARQPQRRRSCTRLRSPPRLLPVGSSCVGGLPCAYALRLGCGLTASKPCPAPTGRSAPDLRARRAPPPGQGHGPGLAHQPGSAHAVSRGSRSSCSTGSIRSSTTGTRRSGASPSPAWAACGCPRSTSTTRATGRR